MDINALYMQILDINAPYMQMAAMATTLAMGKAIFYWIGTLLRNKYLSELLSVRESILNFLPLYSIFLLLNVYRSACVSRYMGGIMRAALLLAGGASLSLDKPAVEEEAYKLYCIFMIGLMMVAIASEDRGLTSLALFILVSLSQAMSLVVDISFYACLATQYYRLSLSTRHIEVKAVVSFVLGFTNSILLYNYLSIYGPTPAMWVIEAMFAILTFGYVFAFVDTTLMLRFHIGFAMFFQPIMITFELPFLKHNFTLRFYK